MLRFLCRVFRIQGMAGEEGWFPAQSQKTDELITWHLVNVDAGCLAVLTKAVVRGGQDTIGNILEGLLTKLEPEKT